MNNDLKNMISEKLRKILLSMKQLAVKAFSTKPRIIGAAAVAVILILVLIFAVFVRKEPIVEPADGATDTQMEDIVSTVDPPVPETQPVGIPATMGTVTVDKLNVHADAGSGADIQDLYAKGDRVEIHDTKDITGTAWGYTGKGWISMDFVRMDDVPPESKDPHNSDGIEITSNGSYAVLGYGVVDLKALNVRAGPGMNYAIIKEIPQGIRYAYYEESEEWVRISDGWVSTLYFYLEGTAAEDATVGTVTTNELNIRTGPDTSFKRIGSYGKDDSVEILAIVNGWGYTEKGWISMIYVELPEPEYTTGSATVTIGLNIRQAPDASSEKVGTYTEGDRITILEVKDHWGKTDKGWINLNYVKYD